MDFYKISEKDLKVLLEAAHSYWALQSGGVDNWEWAGYSICDYLDSFDGCPENFEELAERELSDYTKI